MVAIAKNLYRRRPDGSIQIVGVTPGVTPIVPLFQEVGAFGQAQTQDPNAPTPADLQVIAAGLVAYQKRATDQDVANALAKFTYAERHQISDSMKQQGGDPSRTQTSVEMADRQIGDAPAPVAAWEWVKAGGWMWLAGGAVGIYLLRKVL
jgi:hypothetical protein